VPLILEEIDSPGEAFDLERATVQQVYDQIVKDLTEAKQVLPLRGSAAASGGNAGRWTRGAATFLLGATYQFNPADQAKALAQFEELEAQGYRLITTASGSSNAYRQVFNPSNKNNVESILENQFNVALESGGLRQNLVGGMAPLNSQGSGSNSNANYNRIVPFGSNGGGSYMPTQNLVLSFAGANPAGPATPFDLRYEGGYGAFCPGSGTSGVLNNTADVLRTGGDITLRSPNTSYPELNIASVRDPVNKSVRSNCIAYWTKWRWADTQNMPQSGRDNNNWIVFRYADALLRRAEVLARLNRPAEALVFVNQVRARAGLPGLTGLSGDALLNAILQERAWELAGEGHRWLDLKRFGKASTIIPAHGAERKARVPRSSALSYDLGPNNYRLRYPIRPRDVDLSQCKIKQNPGWGSCEGQ
jgi:starch-binding outer membrane protein, SusD/RagB family